MIRVSVTDLKNRLSEYLRLVKKGEIVEVTERSVPIDRLAGLPSEEAGEAVLLPRLAQDGLVSPARTPPDPASVLRPPVACSGDAVEALVAARGDR